MGRTRTVNSNLPPRMAAVKKPNAVYYYYDTGGSPRWLALGKDYIEAVRKWADLEAGNARASIRFTFDDLVKKYTERVIPTKAPRTQSDNLKELRFLKEFFGGAPLDSIEPMHVRQFREWRTALVRANRELALFSHMFNMAREWGMTDRPNPCAGVKRNKESGRDVYITDAEIAAVTARAPRALALAIELAYLTGQRPADVLKMRETDIRDGCVEVRQGKTGTPVRIHVVGRLAELIAECRANKARHKVFNTSLIVGERGKPISVKWLGTLWREARIAAGIEADIQFRDLRAKAASDKEESGDIREAQSLLGHSTVGMTEHYSRKRRGLKVEPTR